jgi:glycosyltransferase involved in cell wall biosynthesis
MADGSPRRRIAVYDGHWATAGGGEAYAAGVADALSRRHDVTLLAHDDVDTTWLGERLTADLSRTHVEVIDPTAPLESATADFDLLVNLSYRDHGRNGARHGIYVVHFPDRPGDDMARWQRRFLSFGAPLRRRREPVAVVRGFHRPDVIRWQSVRWTNGKGVLRVQGRPGRTEVLTLWLGRYVPGGKTRHVAVVVDGERVAEAELAPPRSKVEVLEPLRIQVPVPGRGDGSLVEIHSESSIAHDEIGNGDRRRLGVPVVGITSGASWTDALTGRASLLLAEPPGTGWLDTYDLLVANSAFTQRWIERWWQRGSTVLEPPVRLRHPGAKDPVILSVGRFFAPGRGHAKKQLEMVQAFSALGRTGLADGWELHLVGGCDAVDRPYVEEVRAAARGLPVVLHVDASGGELDALYRRASIYWHATGLGEDLDADPVRAEHFGITTVEAMSAGAVPVVMAAGGQVDIVRHGVDGLVFTDADGLVAATSRLVTDAELRDELSATAVDRARRYGFDPFAERLLAMVDGLLGASGDAT